MTVNKIHFMQKEDSPQWIQTWLEFQREQNELSETDYTEVPGYVLHLKFFDR